MVVYLTPALRSREPRKAPDWLALTCKPTRPTSPLLTAQGKGSSSDQVPGKQLCGLGRHRVPVRVRKGWERSRERSCGRPKAATETAAAVGGPAAPLPSAPQVLPPSVSSSALSCPLPSRGYFLPLAPPHTSPLFVFSEVSLQKGPCVCQAFVAAESSKR